MSQNENSSPSQQENPQQQPQEQPKVQEAKIEDFINMQVAKTLEEMGFSKIVSEKACLFNSSNIDACLEWIQQHQDDPDFEEEAKVEIAADQKPKSTMSAEEAKIKALEIQERIKKKHEEEDKKRERESEINRIKNIKEMQAAKEAEEVRQMQNFLAAKKRKEKEDAEYKRQVIEEMEKDRCERLGIKYVPMNERQPEKERTKEEGVQYYINTIKTVYNPFRCGDTCKNCLSTLKIFISNILKNPSEEKFKKIKLTNPNVQERVGKIRTALKLLEELGFENQGDFMVLKQLDNDLFNKTLKMLETELEKLG